MINHDILKYAVWLLKREKRLFHIVEQIAVRGPRRVEQWNGTRSF